MSPLTKSRYTLVKGQFWIHNAEDPLRGPQPDGDTVTFIPDSVDLVRSLPKLSGRAPEIRNGRISLRYEGIDALETHFVGLHQDLGFANAARDRNLANLGFTHVRFFATAPNVIESVDKNPLPGYVIANGIEANGRMLGLVYAGHTLHADGDRMFVDETLLDRSVNVALVRAGLAYVEPYDTMPMSLVRHLRAVIRAARTDRQGLWPAENVSTQTGAPMRDLADLQALVMWPKLFRRLAAYFGEGHVGLGEFDAWIRDDRIRRDDTLRLPDGERGNMHDTYTVEHDSLRLRFKPEELLITPDPAPLGF